MDELTPETADPREEIARLEERIEELSELIESCRKFVLVSRLAIALGGGLLLAGLLGAIRADALSLSAGFAAMLGGIVVLGSNGSTARQAKAQRAAAEAERDALIGRLELRVVVPSRALH